MLLTRPALIADGRPHCYICACTVCCVRVLYLVGFLEALSVVSDASRSAMSRERPQVPQHDSRKNLNRCRS